MSSMECLIAKAVKKPAVGAAYMSGALAVGSGSAHRINFDTITVDNYGKITTGVGVWQYEIPHNGLYRTFVSVQFGSSTAWVDNETLNIRINEGGSSRIMNYESGYDTSAAPVLVMMNAFSYPVIYPAGTIIYFEVTQTSGSSLNLGGGLYRTSASILEIPY
jgi:hypothetical protein